MSSESMNEDGDSVSVSISKVAADEIINGIVEPKNVAVVVVSESRKPGGGEGGPVTPDSNREQNHEVVSSPLSLYDVTNYEYDGPRRGGGGSSSSLETPKETLFDSFAPGPDKFMLAPRQIKYGEESRNHVVRRLNFMCSANNPVRNFSVETISDEEHLFEIVYNTVLDAIVSEQTGKLTTQSSGLEGGLGTPKCAPLLSGVAETCPGAPIKSRGKYRNIDKEICRKLEF